MVETQYQRLIVLVSSNDTEECVIWPYSSTKSGHGEVRHPEFGKSMHASRAAFEIANGYLPPVVRHACDNPPCINPKHLVGGIHLDNVADRVERGRSAVGEDNGRSKLSEIDVAEIFLSEDTVSSLARNYSVDRKLIRNIKAEKIWKPVIESLKEGASWSVTEYSHDSDTGERTVCSKFISM